MTTVILGMVVTVWMPVVVVVTLVVVIAIVLVVVVHGSLDNPEDIIRDATHEVGPLPRHGSRICRANLLPISLAWTGNVLGTKQDSAASKSTKVSLKIKNHPLELYTSQ